MKVFIGAVTILSLAYGVLSEKPACEGNEFHPNPIDHHSYYQCHNGFLEQLFCTDGLYYNHVEKQCTGTRPDEDSFPPPPTMPPWWPSGWPTFPTAWPTWPTWPNKPTTDPISTTIKEDEPTDPPCTGYDKYPYPYDCSKYYQCVDGGSLWLNDCPVPLHFNEALNECDWEEAANCLVSTTTDEPTTTTEEPTTTTEEPTTTTTEEPTTTTTEEPTTTTTEEPTTTTTEEPTTTTTEEPTTTTEEPTTTTTEEPTTTTTEEPTTTTTEEPTTTTTEEPTTTTTEEPTTTTKEPTTTTPEVTTPTTPKPGVINCANGEYQPHPTDCTKYYHCSNGTPYLRPCPAGLHFNRVLNVCDWPKDAGCETSGVTPKPTEKPPTGGVTCEVGDIFKPHESDCSKYYSCWTGVAIEQICPAGLHWNQAKMVCDFPADAGCQVTPKPTEGTTTAKPVPTTTKPPGSGEVDCSKGMYHAHPSDCTKFYQCSNGVPYLHHCPSGLHFNPSINVCDWPNAAGCKS